jgi:hypothetical protein
MKIWVAQIEISRAVESKIRSKHNLTGQEIRSAIVACSDISAFVDIHPVHGQRIVIKATAGDGSILLAWLVPNDTYVDVYRLVTARRNVR